jgi:solute carrier family 13 (sodium-dependent dicarboxylate transporter), member 2/3/5
MAALLLFLLPVNWRQRRFTLTWEQAVSIDWGTVLLFAGGIALGRMMLDSGLAAVLGRVLVEGTGLAGEKGITAAAVVGASIISETASNTASANIVVPVMVSIAGAAGVAGLVPAVGATMGASMGFMLPVSTPPNALIYGTRQVTIFQMVRTGLLLDLLGGLVLWAYLAYLAPLWFR